MGEVVPLFPIALDTPQGHNLIVDICRAAEKLVSDDEVREKYGLSVEVWRSSVKNQELVKAVRAEKERRVLNGVAAREAAARSFVKAPAILDEIMTNDLSNPKHKIEAIRELRQTAIGESIEGPPESERFIITINLGEGHVEHFDKPIAPMKTLNREEHDDGEELG
jgi:hypothetical protein